MAKRDFLFELGTEELPPKSLFTLARALADGVEKGLKSAGLAHGEMEWFATPRRLAVRVHGLAERQPVYGFELFTGHRSLGNLRLYARLGYRQTSVREVSGRLSLVTLAKTVAAPLAASA